MQKREQQKEFIARVARTLPYRTPQPKICPHWPDCDCGTQSGPHSCEWKSNAT
jgi:hypothetical protein